MTELTGLPLEQAQSIYKQETGRELCVERTAPPRGLPAEDGVWRVVRYIPASDACGRVTAAFFPRPLSNVEE